MSCRRGGSWFRPGATGARAVLFLMPLFVTLSCVSGGGPESSGPDGGAAAVPALVEGSWSREEVREARELLRAARDSLAVGSSEVATELARQVVVRLPAAPGSGAAMEILARSALLRGEGESALEAAERYVALLDTSHPLRPAALLLRARAEGAVGEASRGVATLVEIPASAGDSVLAGAGELLRELVGGLGPRELEEVTLGAPLESPLRAILVTELAVSFYVRGEDEAAERWALTALADPLPEREERLARGVLEGRLDEVLGRPALFGAILPRSGASPTQLQYGEWVYEGIQVALEAFEERLRRPVQMEVVDDRGQPLGGRMAVRTLEGAGALGVIGPLAPEILADAAAGRQGELPLLSPSAFLPSGEASHVLSLTGPDPAAAGLVARYAWELGLESVAVVRPGTEEAAAETRAFLDEYRGLGGRVAREIVFAPGATFFQREFQEVEALEPDGLFLPLEPSAIQLLAPQVTFYGLDTLGIQLLGTSGWTDELVVEEVDSRHTDGVIAATTRRTQEESEAFQAFRAAYEAQFRKTLRSPVPAFGHDAAALLFTAVERGARTPEELWQALEGIDGFPGATGRLTIEGGRIHREPLLVRIQDHELIYITSRYR